MRAASAAAFDAGISPAKRQQQPVDIFGCGRRRSLQAARRKSRSRPSASPRRGNALRARPACRGASPRKSWSARAPTTARRSPPNTSAMAASVSASRRGDSKKISVASARFQRLQPAAQLAALHRQEAAEQEGIRRQARRRQRREHRGRAGDRHHPDAGGQRPFDQAIAGIGHQRRAGIRDQRDALAGARAPRSAAARPRRHCARDRASSRCLMP